MRERDKAELHSWEHQRWVRVYISFVALIVFQDMHSDFTIPSPFYQCQALVCFSSYFEEVNL
jgi:hypothetical protein